MVIGSTLNDVLAVSAPSKTELQDDEKTTAKAAKEPLSEQKVINSFHTKNLLCVIRLLIIKDPFEIKKLEC